MEMAEACDVVRAWFMIQLVRRRINSSVAFNKCGSSFPAAQAANRKEAQQESNEWERSECVFARFKPASRKTLAARSLSFSLSASEDSACSPPTVILALRCADRSAAHAL